MNWWVLGGVLIFGAIAMSVPVMVRRYHVKEFLDRKEANKYAKAIMAEAGLSDDPDGILTVWVPPHLAELVVRELKWLLPGRTVDLCPDKIYLHWRHNRRVVWTIPVRYQKRDE